MELTEEQLKTIHENMEFMIGHYQYLTLAVADAMTRCPVWRIADGEDCFTAPELIRFAKQQDEEAPLQAPEFYKVTSEGAIGKSPGLEFLTKWILIPLEPGEKRDALLAQMRKETEQVETIATPPPPPVPPTPPPPSTKRFCTQCGAPLPPNCKFCTRCGAKI